MKRTNTNRIIRSLSILMLTIMLAATFEMPTNAGKVSTVKTFLDAEGKLDVANWFDPNDSLQTNKGNLIIPNDSTYETRVISKASAQANALCEEMVALSCDIKFKKLPKGEKFILGLGLSGIEAYSGEAGNVEVEFSDENGIVAGITAYDENGDAQVVAKQKKCGKRVGAKLSVNVVITTDKQIMVTVNGSQLLSGKLPVTGEGRVGLLQTGNCGAEVSNLSVEFMQYDSPENTDFVENFEVGIYNNNLFTIKYGQGPRNPSSLYVEEYEGSNVLMFRNTGLSYFGTKHQYSNFELTFDVPFFVRQVVTDEEGNILMMPTILGVSMGDTAMEFGAYEFGYTASTDLICITPDTVYSNNRVQTLNDRYSTMGFFDKNTNDGFSVQVKMVDGHCTLGMKALDDEKFKTIVETDYDTFKTGYIKLWTTGDGNVAVDNIKIKNLDENPNLIEVPFEAALIESTDYDYQGEELVFRPNTTGNSDKDKSAEFPSESIVIYTVSASLAVFVISAVIMVVMIQRKKKLKAEVKVDEV